MKEEQIGLSCLQVFPKRFYVYGHSIKKSYKTGAIYEGFAWKNPGKDGMGYFIDAYREWQNCPESENDNSYDENHEKDGFMKNVVSWNGVGIHIDLQDELVHIEVIDDAAEQALTELFGGNAYIEKTKLGMRYIIPITKDAKDKLNETAWNNDEDKNDPYRRICLFLKESRAGWVDCDLVRLINLTLRDEGHEITSTNFEKIDKQANGEKLLAMIKPDAPKKEYNSVLEKMKEKKAELNAKNLGIKDPEMEPLGFDEKPEDDPENDPGDEDDYGFGDAEYMAAFNRFKAAVLTFINGKATWINRFINYLLYTERSSRKPFAFCFSQAMFTLMTALINNKHVHKSITGVTMDDAATDESIKPHNKLKVVLLTGQGTKKNSTQTMFLQVANKRVGKDSGFDNSVQALYACGKRQFTGARLSPEAFILADENQTMNSDLYLTISEASAIFDERKYTNEIVNLLLDSYQTGRLMKKSVEKKKSGNLSFVWPCVVLNIQPGMIRLKMKKEHVISGLLDRLFIIHGFKRTEAEAEADKKLFQDLETADYELQCLTNELVNLSHKEMVVRTGDYAENYKRRIKKEWRLKENAQWTTYVENFCDMSLPLIAFAINPVEDLGSDATEVKKTWELAEAIGEFMMLCAKKTYAIVDGPCGIADKAMKVYAKIIEIHNKRRDPKGVLYCLVFRADHWVWVRDNIKTDREAEEIIHYLEKLGLILWDELSRRLIPLKNVANKKARA